VLDFIKNLIKPAVLVPPHLTNADELGISGGQDEHNPALTAIRETSGNSESSTRRSAISNQNPAPTEVPREFFGTVRQDGSKITRLDYSNHRVLDFSGDSWFVFPVSLQRLVSWISRVFFRYAPGNITPLEGNAFVAGAPILSNCEKTFERSKPERLNFSMERTISTGASGRQEGKGGTEHGASPGNPGGTSRNRGNEARKIGGTQAGEYPKGKTNPSGSNKTGVKVSSKYLHIGLKWHSPPRDIDIQKIQDKVFDIARDWFRYSPDGYIVWTTSSIETWVERFKPFTELFDTVFIGEIVKWDGIYGSELYRWLDKTETTKSRKKIVEDRWIDVAELVED
jgi:hypothetical protein